MPTGPPPFTGWSGGHIRSRTIGSAVAREWAWMADEGFSLMDNVVGSRARADDRSMADPLDREDLAQALVVLERIVRLLLRASLTCRRAPGPAYRCETCQVKRRNAAVAAKCRTRSRTVSSRGRWQKVKVTIAASVGLGVV